MTEPSFIYLSCQRDARSVLKKEMTRRFGDLRFSYSTDGFVTYKLPENFDFSRRIALDLRSSRLVFARTLIHGVGQIKIDDPSRISDLFWSLTGNYFAQFPEAKPIFPFRQLHVWSPDRCSVGERLFEPQITPEDRIIRKALVTDRPRSGDSLPPCDFDNSSIFDATAPLDSWCLDCVRLGSDRFWVGFHRVNDLHGRYPGGLLPLTEPSDAASRAWLKFEEALRWSGFPIQTGSRCADLGASPGGGSQALLARGAEVLGVDPAEMDARVLQNPNFTHLRGRSSQFKKKLFRKTRWLIADMNVAPNYTLDVLEELTTYPEISIRGLLFTLKFFDWSMADSIPDYVRRIKSWGFSQVRLRQLTFNRQEIMVAALKKPFHAH